MCNLINPITLFAVLFFTECVKKKKKKITAQCGGPQEGDKYLIQAQEPLGYC